MRQKKKQATKTKRQQKKKMFSQVNRIPHVLFSQSFLYHYATEDNYISGKKRN